MKKNGYYERALEEATKRGADLKKVFSLLEKSLRSGNQNAAYALGTWYLYGKYVKKNIKKAVSLLRQAARHNVPNALYDLAVSYETGDIVKKNLRLAMEYYVRAALQGEKQSVYEVGRCYFYGIGVNKNRRLAWIWLDRAKEIGIYTREMDNAMHLDRNHMRTISKIISKYFNQSEWGKARMLIMHELKKSPDDHWLLTRLSTTYYEEHKYKKALEISKMARKLAPKCPLVLWAYACALDMVGKHKNAIRVCENLLRRGVDKIAHDECGEGIRWARSLLNDCRYRIGISFFKIGNLPAAIRYIQDHLANRKASSPSIFPFSVVRKKLTEMKRHLS